jgi:hypothetical protein
LDHEYPINSRIPVKYLAQDPLFSVILDDKRLSIWNQLDLRVMDSSANTNAGTFNFVITIIFGLFVCFFIVVLYRKFKQKKF